MNIILVCSSLEPDRDGVGDYSRLLAGAFINEGHECALLALNDPFVDEVTIESQLTNSINVPALRIPRGGFTLTLKVIKQWIDEFDPDWLSFQYVIFGYHDKGLPFNLSRKILLVSEGRRWHIMFHELWVGMAVEQSVKLKLWGAIQKRLISSMISRLKPKVIHTQTLLYHQLLKNMGYNATYLPLYSNIPVCSPLKADYSGDDIKLVVFGTIHNNSYIAEFATDAAQYTVNRGKPVTLYFVGRCGNEQQTWIKISESAGLNVKVLGEQPPAVVSELLQNATMGIASTAAAVLEKSGAFAAMHLHKLPVINIAKPWNPIGVSDFAIPQGVMIYKPGTFEKLLAEKSKMTYTYIDPLITARDIISALKSVL